MLVMLWKIRADMFFSSYWTPILTRPTKRLPEPATNTTEQERVLEVTAYRKDGYGRLLAIGVDR
jgi:hypothetical protein